MSIFNHFDHLKLTADQEKALMQLESFVNSDDEIFLLKGYAGSGKTTMIQGLTKYLDAVPKNYALLAPTGRAAKVLADKTRKPTATIHRYIYSYSFLEDIEYEEDVPEGSSFFYSYKLGNNTVNNFIYIIDESSMISDKLSKGEFFRFGSGFLLSDLIKFTQVGEANSRNKIIFVGDPCQLEPVGDSISPALDMVYLKEKYGFECQEAEIREVKRQGGNSGILNAATRLRQGISSGYYNDFNLAGNGKDIFNPTQGSFLDIWHKTEGNKVIIAYKNKTCVDYNAEIRSRLWGKRDLPPKKGDIVIMGANNYPKNIFNGEFAVISFAAESSITRPIKLKHKKGNGSYETIVSLTWREVELVFADDDNPGKIVKGMMLENFLYGDNYIKPEEVRALYIDFKIRHPELKPRTEEFKQAIINDKYFSCLRFKFGYAVTCHKAQGGEWQNVFTVWDYPSHHNVSFYRWAYTAITRASGKLYATDPPFFNSYSGITIIDEEVAGALQQLSGQTPQIKEIIPDMALNEDLMKFEIYEQPALIQDHFLSIRNELQKFYIEVTKWYRKEYEIFFQFEREGQTAGLKTWINKEFKFNGKYALVPSLTNNNEFAAEVEKLLHKAPKLTLARNTVEGILSKVEFDIDTEEKFPFTRHLFDDLSRILSASNIIISAIQHLAYRERYTFEAGLSKTTIDFEYNSKGFFGRVIPLKPDDVAFAKNVTELIKQLKPSTYAI